MPELKEGIKVSDQLTATITIPVGKPVFVKATVLVEDGIFKNGKLYEKGEEVILNQFTAENFEKVGEVEITGKVEE